MFQRRIAILCSCFLLIISLSACFSSSKNKTTNKPINTTDNTQTENKSTDTNVDCDVVLNDFIQDCVMDYRLEKNAELYRLSQNNLEQLCGQAAFDEIAKQNTDENLKTEIEKRTQTCDAKLSEIVITEEQAKEFSNKTLDDSEEKIASNYCECMARAAFQHFGCLDVAKHTELETEEWNKLYEPVFDMCVQGEENSTQNENQNDTKPENGEVVPADSPQNTTEKLTDDNKVQNAKTEKTKDDNAKTEKAKDDNAKTEKAKDDNAKTEKTKDDNAKTEKTKE